MPRSRIAISSVALGLLASGFVVACGSDDEKASGTTADGTAVASVSDPNSPVPPNIITDKDLDSQPEGSPGRALLSWAQSIQFSDPDGVAALSTADALTKMGGRDRLDKAIGYMGATFERITIVGQAESTDSAARLRVWLSTYDAKGKRVAYRPTTFSMVKDGDAWKVADLSLVLKTLRDYERLERDAG